MEDVLIVSKAYCSPQKNVVLSAISFGHKRCKQEQQWIDSPLSYTKSAKTVSLSVMRIVGPCFAEYWTICRLLDATRPSGVFGHFVSQDSPLLQIPAPTTVDRTGRCSSDATVNYITEYETAHHCFSAWDQGAVTGI
ncbi:hypothetical protein ATANTOWER_026643 [Ataeniobius toweri]|uniref:Uncharacterized protein n=1 Tax=Ataeniobius toweri TaxID=208326 RepID=A0ABU7A8V9_9TELE|nr:hypothetical protein [Ataeniobius toweri]